MSKIIFIEGPFTGSEMAIPEGGLEIGRGADSDLPLDDPLVSGNHARILKQVDGYRLVDLGSSNGTELNGQDVTAAVLNEGDVVTIGSTVFTFTGDNSEQGRPVLASAAPDSVAAAAEPFPEPAVVAAAAAPQAAPPPRPKPSPLPPPTPATAEQLRLVEEMKQRTDAIRSEVGKVIVGQHDVLEQVLMCIVARGHALLIGLPGMAKTLMVQTIASVLDLHFKRIQFTPDLMPMDIIGTDVLETDQSTGEKEFRFIPGPIFSNILLADEINRTPPKTQAALLEAMQEKRVTAGNDTYELELPFLVLATQNPIEQEGTYPLPEAQLDRFMFNIWVDYPTEEEEELIVGTTTSGTQGEPEAILTKEDVLALQDTVTKIPVSPHVVKYAIRMVRATRPGLDNAPEITKQFVQVGAGPRAGQYLVLAAKAMAVLDGRIHVSCNDIRRAAIPVLRHRILTNFAADSEGLSPMNIVERLIEEVAEPGEEAYQAQA